MGTPLRMAGAALQGRPRRKDLLSEVQSLKPKPVPQKLIEVSGVIKWFDASKGYGFILPNNGLPDILLHVSCLLQGGYQIAYEGAKVVVEAEEGPKGLQARHILSMDNSTAIRSVQPPTDVKVTPTSGLERAIVKWFNRLKGYGFVTCGKGTEDVFVHMVTLRQFGIVDLRPDQVVLVRFGPGLKGLMATEIRLESNAGDKTRPAA